MVFMYWLFTRDIPKNKYKDSYMPINNEQINFFRSNYKIIDVNYFHPTLIRSKMFNDNFFQLPCKRNIVNVMMEYYCNHKDKTIYEKTDYLCNEKEKVCICNVNASILRQVYDGNNSNTNEKFASLFHENK